MIACALGARFKVLAGEKNFNNEIGVPKTLFGLSPEHQAVVIEMAMRGAGQIAWLAEISRPQIGVITNIGISHIELLGSRDNIAAAKAELLDALPEEGLAVLNSDDDYCDFLRSRCHCPIVTYGVKNDAGFRAVEARFSDEGSRFHINGVEFRIGAPGVHHVINACAASATASHMGIPLDEVSAKLEDFRAPSMRMESITRADGTTILNDAYNAAPDSMRAALETLQILAGGRRTVAVLGDMRELGDHSTESHRYVGETAGSAGIDLLITVGEAAAGIADGAMERLGPSKIERFADTVTAASQVPSMIRPGDLILVKGSRAMEMEKIVRALNK
jgi:UDP-N-acetylmuramoyl-tripeptide--D-alanyl-D-alanine ligase